MQYEAEVLRKEITQLALKAHDTKDVDIRVEAARKLTEWVEKFPLEALSECIRMFEGLALLNEYMYLMNLSMEVSMENYKWFSTLVEELRDIVFSRAKLVQN